MGYGRYDEDRPQKREAGASSASCCVDCRWCAIVVGSYGATSYRCAKTAQERSSSVALVESCGLFAHWRGGGPGRATR